MPKLDKYSGWSNTLNNLWKVAIFSVISLTIVLIGSFMIKRSKNMNVYAKFCLSHTAKKLPCTFPIHASTTSYSKISLLKLSVIPIFLQTLSFKTSNFSSPSVVISGIVNHRQVTLYPFFIVFYKFCFYFA